MFFNVDSVLAGIRNFLFDRKWDSRQEYEYYYFFKQAEQFNAPSHYPRLESLIPKWYFSHPDQQPNLRDQLMSCMMKNSSRKSNFSPKRWSLNVWISQSFFFLEQLKLFSFLKTRNSLIFPFSNVFIGSLENSIFFLTMLLGCYDDKMMIIHSFLCVEKLFPRIWNWNSRNSLEHSRQV